jgi:hypothetical protein
MEILAHLSLFNLIFGSEILKNIDSTSRNIIMIIFIFGICFLGDSIYQIRQMISQKKIWQLNTSAFVVLCTLLGLVGTFYGMAQGVSNLGISEGIGEADFMVKAKGLISGMGTAFQTSLVGIYISILMTFINTLYQLIGRLLLQKYIGVSPLKTNSESPITLLSSIDKNMSKLNQTQDLSLIVQKLELMEKTMVRNDMLATYIKTYITSPLIEIKTEILNQDKNAIRELLNDLKQEILMPIKDEIQKSNQNNLILQSHLQNYVQVISKSIEDMKRFQNQINEEMNKNLKQIVDIQNQTVQTTNTALQQFSVFKNEFTSLANHITNQAVLLLENTSKKLEHQMLDLIPTMIKSVSQETTNQLSVFREEYQHNLTIFLERQNDALEKSLGKHATQLNHVVIQLNQVFDQETQRRLIVSQELDQNIKSLQIISDGFARLQVSLAASATELLPTLSQASEVVGRSLKDSYNYTINLQNNTAIFTHQIKEIIDTIQKYQNQVNEKVYDQLPTIITYLAQVATSLEQSINANHMQNHKKH